MRILFIVTAPPTTRFLSGQLAYLKARGFEPVICSAPGDRIRQTAENDRVEFYEIPMQREMQPSHDIVSLWRLFRLVRKIKPTIVNASTPKAGLLGMICAWLCRVPIRVFQQRGLRLETCQGMKFVILRIAEKITCLCAMRILCNSDSIRHKMSEGKFASMEKLTVLGHGSSKGVDCLRYSINPENMLAAATIRDQYAISHGAPVIGYVGRIVKDKGIAELIEVFKIVLHRYPQARLLIVGKEETGDPINRENFEWMKQNPNVILTGRCDNVIPLYNLFDVLVFPSYREGFPNVVLEAAAMGVPTVGFNATGVVDAVADGETGFIVPMKDTVAMADAVLKYLDDPKLRFKHGLNGRKRIIRDFQPPMLWEAYYQEYCELLRRKNIPVPVPEVEPDAEEVLVAPEEDRKEFVKWYAAKEVVLKNADISDVVRVLNVECTECG